MAVTTRSIGQACLEALPNELLIDIIEKRTRSNGINLSYTDFNLSYIDLNLLLPLTLVSKRWWLVIKTTPTFWTDIFIDNAADLLVRVFLGIHLSKDLAINLHFDDNLPPWTMVEHLIMGVKSLIRTVSIKASYNPRIRPYTAVISRILTQLSPPPLITCIFYNRDNEPIPGIDSIVRQNLTIVDAVGIPLDPLTITHDHRPWRRLTVRQYPQVIYSQVLNVEYLEEIHVWGWGFLYVDNAMEVTWVPPKGIHLSALSGEGVPFCLACLTRVTTCLVRLDIITTVKHLQDALPLLAHLEALQTLKVRVKDHHIPVILPPQLPSFQRKSKPSRCLKELRVTHLTYGEGGTYLESLSSLWKEFRDTMPTVINLGLNANTWEEVTLIVDTGFQDIESLNVEMYNTYKSSAAYTEIKKPWKLPPSVRKLDLACQEQDMSELGYPSVESPSVETLGIGVGVIEEATVSSVFDSSKWPAVRRLNLYGLVVLLTESAFHYLSHIKVTQGNDRSVVTDLCWKLATHVDCCPALKHIELWGSPELDILFIMLERRNCLHNPGMAKLESLGFHAPCHSLHPPIIALLKGENLLRPSNFDLSWEGNANILYDYSIPGCINCHQYMKFCDTPAKVEGEATYSPSVSYLEDSMSVLATWPDRRKVRSTMPSVARSRNCRRDHLYRVFTKYSIEDPTYEWR